MFSGIVEEMATVVAIDKVEGNIDFCLKCSFVEELKIDQSIALGAVFDSRDNSQTEQRFIGVYQRYIAFENIQNYPLRC